jgi:Holin of 3TMs, for gene-transfer release
MKNIIGKIFGSGIKDTVEGIGNAIDKIDNSDEKMELQLQYKKMLADLESKAQDLDIAQENNRSSNVQAEIKGESWLQRNWRPLLMIVFVYIIFNNYVLVSYFNIPNVKLDENVWNLITIGLTGYGAERGIRKTVVPILESVLKKK